MGYKINTIEPLWWALFGAGGFVIALVLPILILLYGIALPLGMLPAAAVDPARIARLVHNPLVKLFLLVVLTLPLFHWAHRFRYFLFDLGLHGGRMGIAVLCYGAAVAGTVLTALILLQA